MSRRPPMTFARLLDRELLLGTLGTLAIFILLRKLTLELCLHSFAPGTTELGTDQLPYAAPNILLASLRHPWLALPLLAQLIYLGTGWRPLRWSRLPPLKTWRWLAPLCALVLAWPLLGAPLNPFFTQPHLADRWLLLVLAAGIAAHPALTAPFLTLWLVMLGETAHPVGVLPMTVTFPPLTLLLLFSASLHHRLARSSPRRCVVLLAALLALGLTTAQARPSTVIAWLAVTAVGAGAIWWQRRDPQPDGRGLWLLTIVAVASGYLQSGLGKLRISPGGLEWLLANPLEDLVAYRLSRGWLSAGAPELAERLLALSASWQGPMRWLILLTELSAVLLLFRRRAAVLLLGSFALMHIALLLFLGVFFWEWLAVDLLLLAALLHRPPERLFGPAAALLAIPLLVASPRLLGTPEMAWHDTPVSYRMVLEAVTAGGSVFELEPPALRPYQELLEAQGFLFLADEQVLFHLAATQDHSLAEEARRAGPDGLAELEARRGRNFANAELRHRFEQLMVLHFWHRNRDPGGLTLPTLCHACDRSRTPWRGQGLVVKVQARFLRQYYDGERMRTLTDRVVWEADIPATGRER